VLREATKNRTLTSCGIADDLSTHLSRRDGDGLKYNPTGAIHRGLHEIAIPKIGLFEDVRR
jgi:hypothetical protein